MLQAIGIAPRPPRNPGTAGDAAERSDVIDIDDDSDEGEATLPQGTVRSNQKIYTRNPVVCLLLLCIPYTG
jgi:hypothetical protein